MERGQKEGRRWKWNPFIRSDIDGSCWDSGNPELPRLVA